MGLFSGIKKAVSGVFGGASGIFGSGITGGNLLSFGGSLLGGMQQNQAAFNSAMMSNDFTREMMQKKHQWQVEDLKAAGLNPVLSAGGASMGNAAMAAVPANALGNAVSTALQARRLDAEIQNMEETNKNLREQNQQIKSQTQLNKAAEIAQRADALLKSTNAKQVGINTMLLESEIPKADALKSVDQSWTGRKFIQVNRFVRNLFGGAPSAINSAASAASKF